MADQMKEALAGAREAIAKIASRRELYSGVKVRRGATLDSALQGATRALAAMRSRDEAATQERLARDLEQLEELTDARLNELLDHLAAARETAEHTFDRRGMDRASAGAWLVNQELVRRLDARRAPPTFRETVNESGDQRVSRGDAVWFEDSKGRLLTRAAIQGRVDQIYADRHLAPESVATRLRRALGPLMDVQL